MGYIHFSGSGLEIDALIGGADKYRIQVILIKSHRRADIIGAVLRLLVVPVRIEVNIEIRVAIRRVGAKILSVPAGVQPPIAGSKADVRDGRKGYRIVRRGARRRDDFILDGNIDGIKVTDTVRVADSKIIPAFIIFGAGGYKHAIRAGYIIRRIGGSPGIKPKRSNTGAQLDGIPYEIRRFGAGDLHQGYLGAVVGGLRFLASSCQGEDEQNQWYR